MGIPEIPPQEPQQPLPVAPHLRAGNEGRNPLDIVRERESAAFEQIIRDLGNRTAPGRVLVPGEIGELAEAFYTYSHLFDSPRFRDVARGWEDFFTRAHHPRPENPNETMRGASAAFQMAREAIRRSEVGRNLDINNQNDLLTWIRAEVAKRFKEDELTPQDFLHHITITPVAGGYPQSLDEILKGLPEHLRVARDQAGDPYLDRQGNPIKLSDAIRDELHLLTVSQNRDVQYNGIAGDMHKVVEFLNSMEKGGSWMLLRAPEWEEIGYLLPNSGDRREGIRPDNVGFGERVKIAVARYLILKNVWYDVREIDDGRGGKKMVPGPKGQAALNRLRALGWNINADDDGTGNADLNFYYQHRTGGLPYDFVKKQRERIALYAGGVNPDDQLTTEQRKAALMRGEIAEIMAKNLIEPLGVSASMDAGGAGDEGLNLLLRTWEYMNGQARSGRPAAGKYVMNHVARIVPDFFQSWRFNIGGVKHTLEDLILDPNRRIRDIPWTTTGTKPNMDRYWAVTLNFGSQMFAYMRGDESFDLVDISTEQFDHAKYNDKVTTAIQLLWKACYIWSVSLPLDDNPHQQIYKDNDGNYPAFATPLDLAKAIFTDIIKESIQYRLPRTHAQRWFRALAPATQRELSHNDRKALAGWFRSGMRRTSYALSGDNVTEVVTDQPFYSRQEWAAIEKETGLWLI